VRICESVFSHWSFGTRPDEPDRNAGDVAQAAAVARFIDAWKAAQTEAKNKPYRSHDEQRYFDSLYDMCALQSLTVLGLLNSTTAAGVADCIENSDVIQAARGLRSCDSLPRNPDCHQQAGRVATGATKLIELEDNVESRSSLFARLARAILPANRSEATLLFKQGLTYSMRSARAIMRSPTSYCCLPRHVAKE